MKLKNALKWITNLQRRWKFIPKDRMDYTSLSMRKPQDVCNGSLQSRLVLEIRTNYLTKRANAKLVEL